MKKVVLFTCLLLASMCVSAVDVIKKDVKKVAIMEVQDKKHALDDSQKLMLQSSLAKAVAKTSGFEAFDRTNLEAIMEEHSFQRTGMVDPKQIQELGKMTGVSYLLLSEAAKSDRKIVLAISLVSVETAKVEMSDNIVMGVSSEDMQNGCDQLASSLFDKKRHGKRITDESNTSKPKEELTKVGSHYVYDGSKMNKKRYEEFLLNRCTPAYKQFHSGKMMIYSGYGTLGLGVLGVGIGAACMTNDKTKVAGKAMVAIGAVSLAGSATLFTFGVLNQRKSIKTFNSSCLSQNVCPIRFDLTAGADGIGLAMKF